MEAGIVTLRITRRFIIEISPTSLFIGIPYVGQFFFGQQLTALDRWKTLRNPSRI